MSPLSLPPKIHLIFIASWPHESMASCLHGLMSSWPHVFRASCLHGVMLLWPHGFMASCLHGFMASCLHYFMASCFMSSLPNVFMVLEILRFMGPFHIPKISIPEFRTEIRSTFHSPRPLTHHLHLPLLTPHLLIMLFSQAPPHPEVVMSGPCKLRKARVTVQPPLSIL